MALSIFTQGCDNLLHSFENWSEFYLNPDALSFGGYLMLFLLVMLSLSLFMMTVGLFKGFFEWISRHLLAIGLSLWLIGVIVYVVGFYDAQLTGVAIVPRAVVSSFKMFVVSNDLARVHEVLRKDACYMTVFSMVHFMAAFITFMFIFKMLGYKIKCSLKMFFYRCFTAKGKSVHVFWGVNEPSILLAEDISKVYGNDRVIFIDVDKDNDEYSPKKATLSRITNTITIKNSEIVRLDKIKALVDHCFNGPAGLTDLTDVFGALGLTNIGKIVRKSAHTRFYFFSDDEEQNIQAAINLQQDKMLGSLKANKPVIYVHARLSANNEVFDHYSQYDTTTDRMEIKMIDSACLSVDKLKQDTYALPVNSVVVDPNTGLVKSPFTALIIGFGNTGLEAFKFLYEYGAFIGTDGKKSPFKCYAIDRQMNQMAGLIRTKMPAIQEEELSLIQMEVDSEAYWEKIKAVVNELNYVVVTLNDDATGLAVAVNLFKYALVNRDPSLSTLKIWIRCYNHGMERRMNEVVEKLNHSIGEKRIKMRLFGNEQELYNCEMILSEIPALKAKEFNRVYESSALSADEQWTRNFGNDKMKRLTEEKGMTRYHAIHDINRRIKQNFSNVYHSTTKMILMGLDQSPEKLERYLSHVQTRSPRTVTYHCDADDAKLLENLAKVEHERWIASHKLMGYIHQQADDSVQKHHHCICQWEELDECTRSYDCNVVDTTIKLMIRKEEKE